MSDDSTRPSPGSDDPHSSVPVPPIPPVPPAPPSRAARPLADSAPQAYGSPPPSAPGPAADAPPRYPSAYEPAPVVPRTLSLVGMILGIVGLVITIFAWGLGFLLSAPAVVLGFLGRRREPGARGFALTAIITGFAGIVLSLIFLAITIVFVVVAVAAGNSDY
ncbi:DUF4190 domain-containing protein [Rathayibacter tritici]|uniref:DUF4190 domain-containing protein n=2 Tax=Rathayibacter tritici TaxID=33888 RepID=A0A160KR86_9MICO|nr:DUF4190 domain-containing protein [Rathayibacter tritici]AND15784.1 hypothetical protein A6122_0628 [Rathayibacter tritici]